MIPYFSSKQEWKLFNDYLKADWRSITRICCLCINLICDVQKTSRQLKMVGLICFNLALWDYAMLNHITFIGIYNHSKRRMFFIPCPTKRRNRKTNERKHNEATKRFQGNISVEGWMNKCLECGNLVGLIFSWSIVC